MFVSLLMALAGIAEPRAEPRAEPWAQPRIAPAIHANVPDRRMTRRGFASAPTRAGTPAPALGYDLPALAFFLRPQSSNAAPRLDYAGYDQPGEWSEAEITARFVREDVRKSMLDEPAAGSDIMAPSKAADHAVIALDGPVDPAPVDRAGVDQGAIDEDAIQWDAAGSTMPDRTSPD